MNYFLFTLVFVFLISGTALAYSPIVSEVKRPYDIISLEEKPEAKQEYLGELLDYPVMYEITSEESFTLKAEVSQLYVSGSLPVPFSLIMVRKNDRGGGVTEVARLKADDVNWVTKKDPVLGLNFWYGESLSREVEAGTYRIEISTVDNSGKYLITFGQEEQSVGYLQMLSNIRNTQKFFGFSVFKMLMSSYVYYMLGVILLVFVIYQTWRNRKLLAHVK
ncbi:hypothetical protein H6784_00330 [Candidatus Nomurabacteria bacterium]|nr:hypothetical protein [Candidatus Kaiserbacteria bacterium]MCB9813839.1 hypothetical protein [Candidatus Nomurabacteria bacterium]